jgi:GntR family transcriptional regulator
LNKEVIPAPPAVIDKLRLRSGGDVVLVRRLRFVDSKPIAIHTSFMDQRVYAPILREDLTGSLIETVERVCGIRVVYSKDTVAAAIVGREDAHLLDIPQGSPVLEVDGVTYTENGQPTRYNKAVYRADCVRLGVTNTNSQAALYNVIEFEADK